MILCILTIPMHFKKNGQNTTNTQLHKFISICEEVMLPKLTSWQASPMKQNQKILLIIRDVCVCVFFFFLSLYNIIIPKMSRFQLKIISHTINQEKCQTGWKNKSTVVKTEMPVMLELLDKDFKIVMINTSVKKQCQERNWRHKEEPNGNTRTEK